MAESVKVAVRVRPFNSREKERNAKLIIAMNGNSTTITDPDGKAKPKDFAFDYSYWSHDQFEDNDGVLEATGSKYAGQRKVFDDLGRGVLKNAYDGYNTSLFAYGQTGSGKSFSMVGYGKNKGIIPITCDELFKTVESNTDATVKYEVWFSMLEIYNEQVRDLLRKDNPKGGLAVKQNPKLGLFYVQGLKLVPVGSYAEIERRIDEGTNNRTVASTQMNATSSRAHTVVTIKFNQITKDSGNETKKESSMNLVDLAGSERADSTGATGDRLKEGANINKSLSALGNVISALADLSTGKTKIVVPYRDSVLTKLLRNALGGNSKTIMIAALSPADINYDETLGTLRYADRAKKIKNKATVNENPMDKLIRELREENEKLKKMLSGDVTQGLSPEEEAKMKAEYMEQLSANMRELDFDGARAEAQAEDQKLQVAAVQAAKELAIPHLTNLNEDPQLSEVVKMTIDDGDTTLGRKDASPAPKITLTGLGIQKQHAIMTNDGKEVTIKPASPGAKIRVNGQPLTGQRALNHFDRLVLGSNNVYLFLYPNKKDELSEATPKDKKIDWDFVQKELAENSGFATGDLSNLSKDQARLQEQILELLPQIAEVNAVSEELDKFRVFEPVILASTGPDQGTEGTKLYIKVKNLQNENEWLWERGKFLNRRFIIQEMYQQYIDGDEAWKKRKQEEDPFWDPLEPVLLGHATVFLQSLAYALDFKDDRLAVTDHKGTEQASLHVHLVPCDKTGAPLGDDDFKESSAELLGKPFFFNIELKGAQVYNGRFNNGLSCKYKFGKKVYKTKTAKATLEPKWGYSEMISLKSVTDDDIQLFENDAVNIYLYADQVDQAAPKAKSKLTTKELKEMGGGASITGPARKQGSIVGPGAPNNSQLTAQMATTQRRLEYLERRDARIQELCKEWKGKIDSNPSIDCKPFVTSVNTIVFSGNRFKTRVKVIASGEMLELYDFEVLGDKHEILEEVRPKDLTLPERRQSLSITVKGGKGLLGGFKPNLDALDAIEEDEDASSTVSEKKPATPAKDTGNKGKTTNPSNDEALREARSRDAQPTSSAATKAASPPSPKGGGAQSGGDAKNSKACQIQ